MESKKTLSEQPKTVKDTEIVEPKPIPSRAFPRLTFILLILIIFVAGYFILSSKNQKQTFYTPPSPSPTPTTRQLIDNGGVDANWRTYINKNLQYSVNYPSNWIASEYVRKYARMGGSQGVHFKPDVETISPEWGLISIEAEENINNINIDYFIENYLCDAPGFCASSDDAVDVIVGGLNGKRVINPPGPLPSEVVVIKKDPYIYIFVVDLGETLSQQLSHADKKTIFNQIISTFKFNQ